MHEQVAIEKPFCRLLRFKRFTDDLPTLHALKEQPTVLVVAPLSGHHATLLRETVRTLLQDHKVYVTDWTDARMVPLRTRGRSTSTTTSPTCRSSSATSAPTCNVISVCQPTVPVLAAISLMASNGEPTPRDDDDDGRPDRRPQEPDRGQQPGDEQEPSTGSRTT